MHDSRFLLSSLVEIARREIGVRETSTNSSERIIEYQRATWLKPAAWPWCAAFTCWVMQQWLTRADVRNRLNLQSQRHVDGWRCHDASAFGWEKWARKHDLQVLDELQPARPGDFVVYDFSHIGIVSIGGQRGEVLETIEGNTNGFGSRDGDGVYAKNRKHDASIIRSFIRVM